MQLELPPQTRAAQFRSASFDPKTSEIEVVFSTGATVRRRSWTSGPYDELLVISKEAINMERLNSGAAPFLNAHSDHSLADVIGSVVPGSARIESGQGIARVKLSSAPSDADIVGKIRDSIIKNVSVGYSTDRVEIVERADDVPLWRVTRWTPIELSAVAIGADAGAHIRSAARSYPATIVTPASTSTADRFYATPREFVILGPRGNE